MDREGPRFHPLLSARVEKVQCYLCDQSFMDANKLNDHFNIHIGISQSEEGDASPEIEFPRNSVHFHPSKQEEDSSFAVKDEVKTESEQNIFHQEAALTTHKPLQRADISDSQEESEKKSLSTEEPPTCDHPNLLDETDAAVNGHVWHKTEIKTERADQLGDNQADISSPDKKEECGVEDCSVVEVDQSNGRSLLASIQSQSQSPCRSMEARDQNGVASSQRRSLLDIVALKLFPKAAFLIIKPSEGDTVLCCVEDAQPERPDTGIEKTERLEMLLELMKVRLRVGGFTGKISEKYAKALISCQEFAISLIGSKEVAVFIGYGASHKPREHWAVSDLYFQCEGKEFCLMLSEIQVVRPRQSRSHYVAVSEMPGETILPFYGKVVRLAARKSTAIASSNSSEVISSENSATQSASIQPCDENRTAELRPESWIYSCPLCQKSFSELTDIMMHFCSHEIEQTSSNHREEIDSRNPDEKQNLRNKKEEKSFKCQVGQCSMAFTEFGHLLTHSKTHFPKGAHKCNFCDKTFESEFYLEHHYASKHSGLDWYPCRVCKKELSSLSCLTNHMKRVHTQEKPARSYECKVCQKNLSTYRQLKLHMRVHTGEMPYTCKVCQKKFTQPQYLKVHEFRHTGEKPYECKICQKKFANPSTLRTHLMLHSGRRPYACKFCPKRFINKGPLNVHMRRHTADKPHQCKVCHKTFVSKSGLAVHSMVHTGEKPHQCEKCGKSFSRTCYLNIHLKMHAGEKPYACDVCGKHFGQSCNMKTHRKTHFKEKSSVQSVLDSNSSKLP